MSQFTDKKWTQTSGQKQRNKLIRLFLWQTHKQKHKNREKRVLHDSMTSIDEKENRGPEGYINLM